MAQTLNMHPSKVELHTRPLPKGDFTQPMSKDIKLSEKEFLIQSISHNNALVAEAKLFISQEEINLRQMLEKQSGMLENQEKVEKGVNDLMTSIKLVKGKKNALILELDQLLEKKKGIVDTIKPDELAKLSFHDFMDPENDIFKWVLESIYKEPKSSYQWKNFKKQALVKDKGADFLVRLKTTSIRKIRAGDLTFGRDIINRENQILQYFEKKGKTNMSLRGLLAFIKIACDIKEKNDNIDAEEETIKEKFNQLAKKDQEAKRQGQPLKILSENIKSSQFFIAKYKTIQEYAQKCADLCQKKLKA